MSAGGTGDGQKECSPNMLTLSPTLDEVYFQGYASLQTILCSRRAALMGLLRFQSGMSFSLPFELAGTKCRLTEQCEPAVDDTVVQNWIR